MNKWRNGWKCKGCGMENVGLFAIHLALIKMNFSTHWFCSSKACASWRRKETSNHRLHGLNPIMPHWVFQQLLAGADHLFHSHTIFVDFECWNCPHIFSTCNSRAVIHIDLEWRAKWHVNVVQIWCGWPWMVLVTLRKLTDGYLVHSVFTNGEILQHCWFEGVIKWTTETPVNFKQTNKIHQIKKG